MLEDEVHYFFFQMTLLLSSQVVISSLLNHLTTWLPTTLSDLDRPCDGSLTKKDGHSIWRGPCVCCQSPCAFGGDQHRTFLLCVNTNVQFFFASSSWLTRAASVIAFFGNTHQAASVIDIVVVLVDLVLTQRQMCLPILAFQIKGNIFPTEQWRWLPSHLWQQQCAQLEWILEFIVHYILFASNNSTPWLLSIAST